MLKFLSVNSKIDMLIHCLKHKVWVSAIIIGQSSFSLTMHHLTAVITADDTLCATHVNKAGYTATEVACGWAGAIFEVTRPFGQEQ